MRSFFLLYLCGAVLGGLMPLAILGAKDRFRASKERTDPLEGTPQFPVGTFLAQRITNTTFVVEVVGYQPEIDELVVFDYYTKRHYLITNRETLKLGFLEEFKPIKSIGKL